MPVRVVVADDEPLIRMGVRCILEDAGHVVVAECGSSDEVVDAVRRHAPDVVLLDIRMPGQGGLEVARQLAAEHPVPIVFLTAYGDRTLVLEAAQAGGYGYILKPVNERQLLAALELAAARWQDIQGLKDALETRKLVERAKGILMQRLGLSEEDAYELLRRRSRNSRRPLRDVARDVLTANEAFRQPRR